MTDAVTPDHPGVVLITGNMAAGRSTVAQRLAVEHGPEGKHHTGTKDTRMKGFFVPLCLCGATLPVFALMAERLAARLGLELGPAAVLNDLVQLELVRAAERFARQRT